jgi:antirestriction protein ArdC
MQPSRRSRKWQVPKGEKSTTICFTKPYNLKDVEAEDGEKTIPVLKHYSVFHASQVDGIPKYEPSTVEEAPWSRPEAAEIILKNSGAVIRIGGDKTSTRLPRTISTAGIDVLVSCATNCQCSVYI